VIWFLMILVVLVMGGVAAVAAGYGAPMSRAYDDRPDALVPKSGPLGSEHVRRVRFSLAFRGYRMSEVDELLDRLARQLEEAEPPTEPPTAQRGEVDSVPGQGEVADMPVVREVRGDDPAV
jgi:DivIVA domain-containing protein